MKYQHVYIKSFGYELAPNVITTEEIESRLEPFFETIPYGRGMINALTGIRQRRFWDESHTLAEHASAAGIKAMDEAGVEPSDVDMVIFCGVGQDGFEPATSCAVADRIGVGPHCQIYDVKNACLGVITGMIQAANAIELGQIRTALVVSCETARQIVESTIREINHYNNLEFYKEAVATLTGGSGAVGLVMTDGRMGSPDTPQHQIIGGVVKNATRHHDLCRWRFEETGMPTDSRVILRTRAQGVLEHGLELAKETFAAFRKELSLEPDQPDKFIGHQVGALHHQKFYEALGIDMKKDFCTYPFLGNTGTVALPITAAIADERGFLSPGDIVGLIGVGSGLNCTMLGVQW